MDVYMACSSRGLLSQLPFRHASDRSSWKLADLVLAEDLDTVRQVLSGSGLVMAVEEARYMSRIDVADADLMVVHRKHAPVHILVMAKGGCWMLLPCLLIVALGSRRPLALLLFF